MCSVLKPVPPIGQGEAWGQNHDVIDAVDPKHTWWMKSWCFEKNHWHRHKARTVYCRHCNKWRLGI